MVGGIKKSEPRLKDRRETEKGREEEKERKGKEGKRGRNSQGDSSLWALSNEFASNLLNGLVKNTCFYSPCAEKQIGRLSISPGMGLELASSVSVASASSRILLSIWPFCCLRARI